MPKTLNKENQNANILAAKEENYLKWNEILEKFKQNFGNDIYESWIKNINLKKQLLEIRKVISSC